MSRNSVWHRSFPDFNEKHWKRFHGNESEKDRKKRERFERLDETLEMIEKSKSVSNEESQNILDYGDSQSFRFPKDPDYSQKIDHSKISHAFYGLYFDGKSMKKVRKGAKPGQDFRAHSTAWEKEYSAIAKLPGQPSSNPKFKPIKFVPVVDDIGLVVGYSGQLGGHRILCHQSTVGAGDSYAAWMWLNNGLPLYVGDPGGEWVSILGNRANLIIYNVLTGVDGEITAIVSHDSKDVAEPVDFWLLDAAQAAYGGVVVAAGVVAWGIKGAIKTLARRGAKRKKIGSRRIPTTHVPTPRSKGAFVSESGMTEKHFKVFSKVAEEENVIIMVRTTNPKSTPLIAKGAHGKPMELKIKTSKTTGVVTAKNASEIDDALKLGYYVVDEKGVAKKIVNGKTITMKPRSPYWKLEKGQVLHPKTGKPMVGDYDLMGVAPMGSKGRNIALATRNGEPIKNLSGPESEKIRKKLNSRFDEPRVLHGGQDQYADFSEDSVIVFLPNGRTIYLKNQSQIEAYYKSIGRTSVKRKYGPHTKNKNPDISPAGRR